MVGWLVALLVGLLVAFQEREGTWCGVLLPGGEAWLVFFFFFGWWVLVGWLVGYLVCCMVDYCASGRWLVVCVFVYYTRWTIQRIHVALSRLLLLPLVKATIC